MTRLATITSGFAVLALATAAPGRQPADDLSPETKALVTKLKEDVRNRSAATRTAGYKSMGDLGKYGHVVRRTLCEGMLDPIIGVRTAAADALKQIDEPLYKDATVIYIEKDVDRVEMVARQRGQAEPLVPLIMPMVVKLGPAASLPNPQPCPFERFQLAHVSLARCVRTLVAIAPDDELVNKTVLTMLTNAKEENRAVAVDLVEPLKNRKLAVTPLIALAGSLRELEGTRAKAILLLPVVADENTRAKARKAAEAVRFDEKRLVREAAEAALKQFGD